MSLLVPFADTAEAQTVAAAHISAVWANDGGDKVTQDELRASKGTENKTGSVHNRVWDGRSIRLFAARNEVVSANIVLEAAKSAATNVTVTLTGLTGPNGARIASKPAVPSGAFTWTDRPIELFVARYVPIRGLSYFGYFKGDERQIPVRFQASSHRWSDRPDHDKLYPDALVPMEAIGKFDIAQAQNQSIWIDIDVPKQAAAGPYTGEIKVAESGVVAHTVPVQLTVEPFALPDAPTAKTMLVLDTNDIIHRYVAPGYVNWASEGGRRAQAITDTYYQLLHRHKIGVVGENECPPENHPCESGIPRLTGALYTAKHGYSGPGTSAPNDIYSIGTYGTWPQTWHTDQKAMTTALTEWAAWAQKNTPATDYVLYLQDEPPASAYGQIETWAKWMSGIEMGAKRVFSLVTMPAVLAKESVPDLAIPVQPAGTGNCPAGQNRCDNIKITQALRDFYSATPGRKFWVYNDGHPGAGSVMTEDDGIAMRTFGWAQWKKGVDRWFYWYGNINCGSQTNCGDWFQNATTWGHRVRMDESLGMWGDDAPSNGNGLLIYPGTDVLNPASSLKLGGPIASIRLKEWRRGIQDADYLALAQSVNAAATAAVVNKVMPRALWEIANPDPTFYSGEMPYSSNPDDWEAGRSKLADIISGACAGGKSPKFCQ